MVDLGDGRDELVHVEPPVPVGVHAFEEAAPGEGWAEDVVLREIARSADR